MVPGTSLSGSVTFGPVDGGTVDAFAVEPNGANGALLGSTTCSPTGAFALRLVPPPTGSVRLVVSGGTYVSEMDDVVVGLGTRRFGLLLDVGNIDATDLSISPVSAFIDSLTRAKLAVGQPLPSAHAEARAALQDFYGLATDPERLRPAFASADLGTDAFKLGFVLGGLEALAKDVAENDRAALVEALASDVSDNLFDGMADGAPVVLGTGRLPFTAGSSDFLQRLGVYAATGARVHEQGINLNDLAPTFDQVRGSVAASPLTLRSAGLSASSSGAISTLAFGGKQWIFVAARDQGVVAIDVTDPTAAAPEIKSWPHIYTDTFNRTPVGGVVPLLGADHPQLFVYAYGSKHAALVDADTGVVELETDLAIASPTPIRFSGGSAFVAGGIPDLGRDGIWLATADGYVLFHRPSATLTTAYEVEAGQMLSENLGADIVHGTLFCPNYLTRGGGGIQLVDLIRDRSYSMDDNAYATAFRLSGLHDADAGAVDPAFQVGIVTGEDNPNVGFVNLATITRNDAVPPIASTFTPAARAGTAVVHIGNGLEFSGCAVDADTHLVLFMAGYSTDVGVGLLQDPAAVATGEDWLGLLDWRYQVLPAYRYARDPHAVAVVKNVATGKAYGYLLDGGNRKCLQVDLAAFLAVAPVAGGDGHRVGEDLRGTAVVLDRAW
ncbi:MAG: hypothetical protein R3F56_00205 [Planctomycetota bacterium]